MAKGMDSKKAAKKKPAKSAKRNAKVEAVRAEASAMASHSKPISAQVTTSNASAAMVNRAVTIAETRSSTNRAP